MSRRRFSCCGFVVLHEAARLVEGACQVSRRGMEITGGSTSTSSTFKKNSCLENYKSTKGWIDDEILHLCVYQKVLIISSSLHPNIFGELIKASFQKDSSGITSNNNQGQLVTSAFPTFGNITPREWYKYPLVNIQITMENHHVEWENPLCLWSFSRAILT